MDEKNTQDFGRVIGDAVQDALRTGDYTRLRQMMDDSVRDTVDKATKIVDKTVPKVVSKTVETAEKAERVAQQFINQGINSAKQGVNNAKQNMNDAKASKSHIPPPYRPYGHYRYPPRKQASTPTTPTQTASVVTSKKKALAIRHSNSNTALGVFLTFTGFFVGIPTAILTAYGAFQMFSAGGMSWPNIIPTAILASITALSLFTGLSGCRVFGRARRLRQYWQIVSEKCYCDIKHLADAVGKKPRFVQKELRALIDKRTLPEGHLDDQASCLIIGDGLYQQYKETQTHVQKSAAPSKDENPVFAAGVEAIRQIRSANAALSGKEISDKLSRLEEVVTQIFAYVQQHPSKLSDIRRFMDYYLPTAVKLVQSYQEFDAQPQTESVVTAKSEILNILDTINSAFGTLLNDLFKDDAMDISTDISALKTMLAQEGLTGSTFEQRSKEND